MRLLSSVEKTEEDTFSKDFRDKLPGHNTDFYILRHIEAHSTRELTPFEFGRPPQ